MVKVISLSEAAYAALLRRKRSGMSFSDVVMSTAGKDAEQKTETHADLYRWLKAKSEGYRGKRKSLVKDIDKIIYGV